MVFLSGMPVRSDKIVGKKCVNPNSTHGRIFFHSKFENAKSLVITYQFLYSYSAVISSNFGRSLKKKLARGLLYVEQACSDNNIYTITYLGYFA